MYKRQDDGKGPVAHIQENAPYALRTCTPKTTALQIPPTMPLLQRGIPVLLAVPLRLQNLPELHARESVGHDLQRYYMAMPRLRRLERLRQSVNFYSSHKHDFIFDARPQTIAVADPPDEGSAAAENETVKREPWRTTDFSSIFPLCLWMIELMTAKPRPVPLSSPLVVKKGSKMDCRISEVLRNISTIPGKSGAG
jgi:hypothetical protein